MCSLVEESDTRTNSSNTPRDFGKFWDLLLSFCALVLSESVLKSEMWTPSFSDWMYFCRSMLNDLTNFNFSSSQVPCFKSRIEKKVSSREGEGQIGKRNKETCIYGKTSQYKKIEKGSWNHLVFRSILGKQRQLCCGGDIWDEPEVMWPETWCLIGMRSRTLISSLPWKRGLAPINPSFCLLAHKVVWNWPIYMHASLMSSGLKFGDLMASRWRSGHGRSSSPWGQLPVGSLGTMCARKNSPASFSSLRMISCSVCKIFTFAHCLLCCCFFPPMCGISCALVMEVVFENFFLLSNWSLSWKEFPFRKKYGYHATFYVAIFQHSLVNNQSRACCLACFLPAFIWAMI